jgi:hypothetical protein
MRTVALLCSLARDVRRHQQRRRAGRPDVRPNGLSMATLISRSGNIRVEVLGHIGTIVTAPPGSVGH